MDKRLRVLSYNIHKGFTTGNRAFVLHRIRDAIRSVHADLVMLQEVQGHHSSRPATPQLEYLADELWPHYAYGRNAVYTSGHHGNAILSKFPFSFWENIDVSTNRLERRGILHGVIEVPHRRLPLHALCVHLGLLETERKSQVDRLCRRIDQLVPHDEPLLIGGDFNDWRGRVSPSLRKQTGAEEAFEWLYGSAARTFPSWLPALRLDRVYARGMAPLRAEALTGAPWNQLSDHAALLVELAY